MGFAYSDNMFQLIRTKNDFLQFAISVQKNLYDDSYKVNPSIILRNPFIPPYKQQLLVLGNLRPDGVYLHVNTQSWWPRQAMEDALDSLKKHAMSWYDTWGEPDRLAEVFETAINEKRAVIDVIEPLPEKATMAPWREPELRTQVPPAYLRDAAVLHFLAGNSELAKRRTEQWIRRIEPSEAEEKTQASMQLASLNQST